MSMSPDSSSEAVLENKVSRSLLSRSGMLILAWSPGSITKPDGLIVVEDSWDLSSSEKLRLAGGLFG